MKHTATKRNPGRGPIRALRARLRERLDAKSERGDLLIEVLIAMAVAGTALASYTTSNTTMEHISRSQTATDIVAQQAQGVLQAAKSAPWDRLGFNPGDQTGFLGDAESKPTVVHAAPASDTDDLTPFKSVSRGNVTMQQRTDVVWVSCGGATCTNATNPGSYGTKKVIVTITFRVPGTDTDKTKKYTMSRSATASEVAPIAVAVAEAPLGSTAPVDPGPGGLACPVLRAERDDLVWDPVPGAQWYYLALAQGENIFFEDEIVTDTMLGSVVEAGYRFKVESANDTGARATCPWQEF